MMADKVSIRKQCRQFYRSIHQRLLTQVNEADLARPAIVFSPHQDDETLGCGGTILRKKRAGASVHLVFLTNGSGSHRRFIPDREMEKIRLAEAKAASQILGVEENQVHFLGYPDGRLKRFEIEATETISALLAEIRPEEVFVPYAYEPPTDHAATYQIVVAALQKTDIPVMLYEYPIWFWDQWPWTERALYSGGLRKFIKTSLITGMGSRLIRDFRYFIPIQETLALKRVALDQYRSQMTRLVPDPDWLILGDIACGDFLNCFFQEREVFKRSRLFSAGKFA